MITAKARRALKTAPRFCAVGAIGVVVNMLSLQLLYGMVRLPLLVATSMAAEAAVVQRYLLHNRWTFGRHPLSLVRFATFNLSSLLALLLNVAVVAVLVRVHINYVVADLVGIGMGTGLNFAASLSLIWTVDQ
jgi:putative flippase GtrA